MIKKIIKYSFLYLSGLNLNYNRMTDKTFTKLHKEHMIDIFKIDIQLIFLVFRELKLAANFIFQVKTPHKYV